MKATFHCDCPVCLFSKLHFILHYSYSSDCEIEVQVKGVTAGIKDLQVN